MGFEGGYLRILFTTGGGSGALTGYCGLKRWFFKVISVYMVVESLSDGAVDFSYIFRNSGISVSDLREWAMSEGSMSYELSEVPVKWISGRFYLFMCVSWGSISDCEDLIWLSASRPFFTFRA